MKKSYKITVTKADIAGGLMGDAAYCPIAKAVTRALGHPVFVYANGPNGIFPKSVINFIRLFDTGKPVKPFSFIFKPNKPKE